MGRDMECMERSGSGMFRLLCRHAPEPPTNKQVLSKQVLRSGETGSYSPKCLVHRFLCGVQESRHYYRIIFFIIVSGFQISKHLSYPAPHRVLRTRCTRCTRRTRRHTAYSVHGVHGVHVYVYCGAPQEDVNLVMQKLHMCQGSTLGPHHSA